MSKGSAARPFSVPRSEYDRRWTETFAAALPDRFRLADGEGEWTFLIRDPEHTQNGCDHSQTGNAHG